MIVADALRYDLVAVLTDGATLSLRPLLEGLQWEEQPKELSVRLQARVSNQPTSRGLPHQL
ncbi:MAG TPA: hypothetical protein VNM48_00205, partial [Chloroflexota bacterium]|nr:hypothetical protein [Chloroflexota bacterium]